MRIIKFRYWEKPDASVNFEGKMHYDSDEYFNKWCGNPEYETMQFTGLLDRHGKEIYEGDIVTGQYSHYDPLQDAYIEDEKMGGIVFFNEHKWSFKAIQHLCDKDREGKMRYFDLFDEKLYWGGQRFGDMEVIGNVYENPELLK